MLGMCIPWYCRSSAGPRPLDKKIEMSKTLRYLLPLTAVGLVGALSIQSHLQNDAAQRYKDIFKHDLRTGIFYPRKDIVSNIRTTLSNNPNGLIYVTGRMGAGKTSAIREALNDREFVASINWRSNDTNVDNVAEIVKKSFGLKEFKDYFGGLKFGWLLKNVLKLIPVLEYDHSEISRLSDFLDELEIILRFRPPGTKRPAIYIDEVANLRSTKENAAELKMLFDWLVKVSRDFQLCDIIVSTADAFVEDTVGAVDPKYVKIIRVDDLGEQEIASVLETYRTAKSIGAFNLPPRKVLSDVGGLMGDVKIVCEVGSEVEYNMVLMSTRQGEREFLQTALSEATKLNWYATSQPPNTFTEQQLRKVLDEFCNVGGPDPQIKYSSLLNSTKIPISAIRWMVKGPKKYLYLDPLTACFRVRSKLFLDAYKELTLKERAIERIQSEQAMCRRIIADKDSLYVFIEQAKDHLQVLENELKSIA